MGQTLLNTFPATSAMFVSSMLRRSMVAGRIILIETSVKPFRERFTRLFN